MISLDERGKQCPIPIVDTKKAVEPLGVGEVVETVVDNEISAQNLKKFADQRQYAYEMDAPLSRRAASLYAMGISELTALDQGEILVLEREFYVPSSKLGAWVNHKIYVVKPQDTDTISMDRPLSETSTFLKKRLLYEWKTTLSLFKHDIANYEGMCLGPRLADGRQVVLLVSDSQNQYAGVLKDWFKTILIQ